MANFTYQGTIDGGEPTSQVFDVVAGTTASIAEGDVVVMANGYAALVGDGECAATGFYGLAVQASNETATAAGTVEVIYYPQGLKLRGVPTTPANLATAIKFDRVSMDLAAAVQTVDENDPNAAYALLINDYSVANSTIDVFLLSNY